MNEADRKTVAMLVSGRVRDMMCRAEFGWQLQSGQFSAAVRGEVYVALADVRLSQEAPRVGTAGTADKGAPSDAELGLPAVPRELDEAFQRARALAHERDRLLYQIANVVSGMAAYHQDDGVRRSAVELGKAMSSFRHVKNDCDVAAHAGDAGTGVRS